MDILKKYTANYCYTNPNFTIQNLNYGDENIKLKPQLYVLKNILQRGFPTIMSRYLQSKIGNIHELNNFQERFLFVDCNTPRWVNTIKGDPVHNYFPAKDFLERIIPREFGEYSFIGSLILPEADINEITDSYSSEFVNQKVDFYLPQARMVIEIDGQQHKLDDKQRVNDYRRDVHLDMFRIKTFHISTTELNDGRYKDIVIEICNYLRNFESILSFYRNSLCMLKNNDISSDSLKTKLLPTAIIRFQILFIDLILNNYLSVDKPWRFNIFMHEKIGSFAELAIEDIKIWLNNLWILKYKEELKYPEYVVEYSTKDSFVFDENAINIDFSLLKKYTDENESFKKIIYVRTDYFDVVKDKNYFRVCTTNPIRYNIRKSDEEILEFFLQNIFGKEHFRAGQFQILANVLNLNDTIGLLPTGGGKSLCYQMPCLLQPSINFVVCPIKSLMYDQYDNMVKSSVLISNVNFISGDMSAEEKSKVLTEYSKGRYLFIWISPERFQIKSFRESIKTIVCNFYMAYAVIDEVHCMSEWGHDFRTSYLNLVKTIDALSPKDRDGKGLIHFVGLTATASINVLQDIKIEFSREKKKFEEKNVIARLDFGRDELQFNVIQINDGRSKNDQLFRILSEECVSYNENHSVIVFTPNVNGNRGCYDVCSTINGKYQGKVGYFAGKCPTEKNESNTKVPIMSDMEFDAYKKKVQNKFKHNELQILVATKSFGMGIDKENIYSTIHYGLPSSVEALYQEAGRAGRWDKRIDENKNKKAHCYVLYNPELDVFSSYRKEMLAPETSFSRIREILKTIGSGKQDIGTQMFLFSREQPDVEQEYQNIKSVIETYYQNGVNKTIYVSDVRKNIRLNESEFEKVIYRLTLLGVAKDWTRDFKGSFEVSFAEFSKKSVIKHVSDYIHKYEADLTVEDDIIKSSDISGEDIIDSSIKYLLEWIFKYIVANRKKSLENLDEWCENFESSEQFKSQLDAFFNHNDDTFIMQHIAEQPSDWLKWFDLFYHKGKKSNYLKKIDEFEALKYALGRILESYPNNVGLNFVSGFIRLVLKEYDYNDGRNRMESALNYIYTRFDVDTQVKIIDTAVETASYILVEKSLCDFVSSILKFYPERRKDIASYLKLEYLLNDYYEECINKIKSINKQLYGQIWSI